MSQSSKPTPIAIPNELAALIDQVAAKTHLSKQDIMRLSMTIGLADMQSVGFDLGRIIREAAADKGASFVDWAKSKSQPQPPTNILPIDPAQQHQKAAEDPKSKGPQIKKAVRYTVPRKLRPGEPGYTIQQAIDETCDRMNNPEKSTPKTGNATAS